MWSSHKFILNLNSLLKFQNIYITCCLIYLFLYINDIMSNHYYHYYHPKAVIFLFWPGIIPEGVGSVEPPLALFLLCKIKGPFSVEFIKFEICCSIALSALGLPEEPL